MDPVGIGVQESKASKRDFKIKKKNKMYPKICLLSFMFLCFFLKTSHKISSKNVFIVPCCDIFTNSLRTTFKTKFKKNHFFPVCVIFVFVNAQLSFYSRSIKKIVLKSEL